MSRPKPAILLTVLVAALALLGGVSVLQGGFYVAKHEGDTLHLLQILLRMADGEWPHLDFVTPIGVMAFLPIVAFLKAGLGAGEAILWSQVLVALVLLPATFWAAHSRFSNGLAYLFGISVMVLTLALVHGESDRLVSISMHYNRWAWAVAYIVVILAVLPPVGSRRDGIDGTIIGLGMALLAVTKVTYFISFAPAVLIALILYKAHKTLLFALVAGLAVAAVITVAAGPTFWGAYVSDLIHVARSDVRPAPGVSLNTLLGAPAYLGGSLTVLAGIIFLRQAGEEKLGLLLLLLAPGFFYVTYQNFGNDPQWLVLFAILLLAPKVSQEVTGVMGLPMRTALMVAGVAALSFATPSMLNLAYSPFRHATLDADKYSPLLAKSQIHNDLFGLTVRSNRVDGSIALDVAGGGLEDRRELGDREDTHAVFKGEPLPDCELTLGLIAWFETIVANLETSGFGGASIYAADIFTSHWLFGDIKRLEQGAPWYYGGLPGIDHASHVIIPMCPASLGLRRTVLDVIEERGIPLREVHRHPLYILVAIE